MEPLKNYVLFRAFDHSLGFSSEMRSGASKLESPEELSAIASEFLDDLEAEGDQLQSEQNQMALENHHDDEMCTRRNDLDEIAEEQRDPSPMRDDCAYLAQMNKERIIERVGDACGRIETLISKIEDNQYGTDCYMAVFPDSTFDVEASTKGLIIAYPNGRTDCRRREGGPAKQSGDPIFYIESIVTHPESGSEAMNVLLDACADAAQDKEIFRLSLHVSSERPGYFMDDYFPYHVIAELNALGFEKVGEREEDGQRMELDISRSSSWKLVHGRWHLDSLFK